MKLLPILMLLASPAIAGEGPITIRGLSLESTPEELGSAESFGVDDLGRVSNFTIHCSFINGCDYSVPDLVVLLKEGLGLEAEPVFGEFEARVDGPAGDRLIVVGDYIQVWAMNYRKPPLRLE